MYSRLRSSFAQEEKEHAPLHFPLDEDGDEDEDEESVSLEDF